MSEQAEAEAPTRPLFRAAALRHGADRLHGTVRLATPLGWQIIGFLLLGSVVVVALFLGMASYARVETATGAITLDRGVAAISASRPGVVDALFVKTGDVVAAGQPLARIQSEEQLIGGATASERTEDALKRQDARLVAQGGLLLEAARAERARYREQLAGLLAEITSLDGQIADQKRLVAASETEASRTAEVAERGFISRRDLEDRRAVLIGRRQRLAELEQLRSSKSSSAAEARSAIVQAAATAQAQVASTESERAEISQRLATTASAPGYVLIAPVPGRVTALTARPGQRASAEQPVMVVVPARSRLQVELYVPTAAAGFLATGQEVRLAVDAFPYQRFGTVIARVQDVSTVTVAKSGANGPVPVYLVTGELQRSSVEAFGRLQPLVPGMTLTARIVTERRSLLEWLFEPLFAIRRR